MPQVASPASIPKVMSGEARSHTANSSRMSVILSERGPERFLQFGGGESKDLLFY
jgi:hypothetical protein